jgi:glycerol kinase
LNVEYVAAIDQGTSSSRCLVFDLQGRIVSLSQKEHEQIFPRPGWVEHDPREILRNVIEVVHGALDTGGLTVRDLVAVGIANQRETTVVWDPRTGEPVHNAIVWQDTRTDALCRKLGAEHGQDRFRDRCGLPLATYFSGPKVSWLLDSAPGLRRRAEEGELLFGTMDSWLVWNLTGRHVTDVTNASRTMLMNLETLDWDDTLLDAIGVPRAMLPAIQPSSQIYGEAGGSLGGVPIAAALGDQQAALFGQACFDPGLVKVTYGTGSFALANAGPERPPAPDGLTVSCAWDLGMHAPAPAQRVAYALEGSAFVSGAAIQWLRDGLGIISTAAEVGPLAASVPDSGGVTFVPALTGLGSPWWDPTARGIITGITRGAGRAQIARACVEAMAFQVRDMTDAMAAASAHHLSTLRADGGAAAMDLLLQLQAEQSRMPVARPRSLESTALGAATLAGLAEGMWGSLDDLAALWSASATFEPELPVELTDAVYAVWRRAVERAQGWAQPDDGTPSPPEE